jgi:membrane protein
VALFFGASAVVVELRDALNTIWRVPEPSITYWASALQILKSRALSFAMVVGVGFLLMVSLLVNAWLAAMDAYFGSLLPTPAWILQVAYSLASFVVIGFLFALVYKLLPDVTIQWSDVAVGAAGTSLLFTLGKFAIGVYLGRAGFASTYGAAGSLVIVLLWVYYSAQIFFFGAEFTCVYTHLYGSMFRKNLEVRQSAPEVRGAVPESFEDKKRILA